MNNVVQIARRQFLDDEAEWGKDQAKKDLDSQIMSNVYFFEDHGEAVADSEFCGDISVLMTEAYQGVRSEELLQELLRNRKHIEDRISGAAWEGH